MMTDYPQWPFEVSQINRSDRACGSCSLRLIIQAQSSRASPPPLIGKLLFPVFSATSLMCSLLLDLRSALTQERAALPGPASLGPGLLGLRASRPPGALLRRKTLAISSPADAINSYRAPIVGGDFAWTSDWAQRLATYVRNGGIVVLNAAQAKGLPSDLLGVRLTGANAEADSARCLAARRVATGFEWPVIPLSESGSARAVSC